MQTDTLTEKLHARADSKLRAEAEALFGSKLFEKCGAHSGHGYGEITGSVIPAGWKGPENNKVWHGEIWEMARQAYIERLRPIYREREVAEFMGKVEALETELAELRETITDDA